GVLVVEPEQVRPDELEQVDALGVQRVDACAAKPARDLRARDAEHVSELSRRAEVGAERLDLPGGGDGHERQRTATRSVAQQILLRWSGRGHVPSSRV